MSLGMSNSFTHWRQTVDHILSKDQQNFFSVDGGQKNSLI